MSEFLNSPPQMPFAENTRFTLSLGQQPIPSDPQNPRHILSLGMTPLEVRDVVVRKYGNFYPRFFQEFFRKTLFANSPVTPLNGVDTVMTRIGTEIIGNCQVKGTATPSGVGLSSILVDIIPFNGSSTDMFAPRQVITASNLRDFIITEKQPNPDGSWRLKLVPFQNTGDLAVVNGQSVDFPDKSMVTPRAVLNNMYCFDGETPVWTTNYQQFFNKIQEFHYTLTRTAGIQQYTSNLMDFGSVQISEEQSIKLLCEKADLENWVRQMYQMNWHLLHGEANFNKDINSVHGWGLIPQIPTELKHVLPPGGLSYKFLTDMLFNYKMMNNDYVGQELVCYIGTLRWREFQDMAANHLNIIKRMEPLRSPEEVKSKANTLSNDMFDSVYEIAGDMRIRFIVLNEMGDKFFSPIGAGGNLSAARSIHDWDMILIDPSPVKNLDIQTMTMRNEAIPKVEFFERTSLGEKQGMMFNKQGMYDWMSNKWIQGTVPSFERTSTCDIWHTQGVMLHDPAAVLYLSPIIRQYPNVGSFAPTIPLSTPQ